MQIDTPEGLASRLARLEAEHADLRLQITGVKTEVLTTRADFKTEIAILKNDLGYIKDSQEKVVTGLNRILWAVGLVILGGFGTFILNGGLVGPL